MTQSNYLFMSFISINVIFYLYVYDLSRTDRKILSISCWRKARAWMSVKYCPNRLKWRNVRFPILIEWRDSHPRSPKEYKLIKGLWYWDSFHLWDRWQVQKSYVHLSRWYIPEANVSISLSTRVVSRWISFKIRHEAYFLKFRESSEEASELDQIQYARAIIPHFLLVMRLPSWENIAIVNRKILLYFRSI